MFSKWLRILRDKKIVRDSEKLAYFYIPGKRVSYKANLLKDGTIEDPYTGRVFRNPVGWVKVQTDPTITAEKFQNSYLWIRRGGMFGNIEKAAEQGFFSWTRHPELEFQVKTETEPRSRSGRRLRSSKSQDSEEDDGAENEATEEVKVEKEEFQPIALRKVRRRSAPLKTVFSLDSGKEEEENEEEEDNVDENGDGEEGNGSEKRKRKRGRKSNGRRARSSRGRRRRSYAPEEKRRKKNDASSVDDDESVQKSGHTPLDTMEQTRAYAVRRVETLQTLKYLQKTDVISDDDYLFLFRLWCKKTDDSNILTVIEMTNAGISEDIHFFVSERRQAQEVEVSSDKESAN